MIQQQTVQNFSLLSADQLNWKPYPSKWSIAQCLEHLIVSNSSYFPVFDKILTNEYGLTFVQRLNPFKKLFGRMLIKLLGPRPLRKFHAPRIFKPSSSQIMPGIVEEFSNHQNKIKNYFIKLLESGLTKTTIASPASSVIIYSISDALQIITGHEQRHVNQAINVLNHQNFPK
jgi:hypothetical protein